MADVPAIRITAEDRASSVIAGVGKSLGAFAASVASVASAIAVMRSALRLGDDLQKIADTTGVALAQLDELSIIASQNGASLEDMAKSFKFLNASMVEGQRASSQAGQLFEALGVKVKDSDGVLRDVNAVMGETAKALEGIENESTRTAAGVAIFGKSYTTIAATLRNYTESQKIASEVIAQFGGVSKTAAGLADQFGDRLDVLGQGGKRALLHNLQPGLAAVNLALEAAAPLVKLLAEAFGTLVSFVAEKVAGMFVGLQTSLQQIGILGKAAWDSLRGFSTDPLKKAFDEVAELERKGYALVRAQRLAGLFPGLDDSDRVSRAAEAHARLTETQKRLNEEREKAARIAALLAPADKRLAEAAKELAKAQEAIIKGYVEAIKVQEESQEAVDESLRAALKGIEALKQEADQIGLTDTERKVYNANLARAAALLNVTTEAERNAINALYDEQEALIRANGARLGSIESYKKLQQELRELEKAQRQTIEGAISYADDALFDIITRGSEGFRRLWNDFVTYAIRAFTRVAAQDLVINLVGGGTGAAGSGILAGLFGGGGGGGTGAGGIGGLFSNVGNFFNTGGLVSGGLGQSFAFSGLGQSLGLSGAAGLSELGGLALTSLGSTLGAAIPIIGIGLAIANAFGAFRRGGGPKEGGFASIGYTPGVADAGVPGRYYSQTTFDAPLRGVVETIGKQFERTLALLGGTPGQAGFALGFDTDPRGTSSNRLTAGAFLNGTQVYHQVLQDLGRDDTVLQAALETESKRALLAALQASEFPETVANILNSITAATAADADVERVLALASAFKELQDVVSRDPLADAMAAIEQASRGAYGAMVDQAAALREMLNSFDGSLEATQQLTSATRGYYQAQVQLFAQIEEIRRATGSMFGDTIRSLQLQVLDNQGKYGFLQADAEQLRQQLFTTSDPDTIRAIAERINADIQQAFGLLEPEQQRALLDQFIAGTREADALVQERLAAVRDDLSTSARDVFAEINTRLEQVAAQLAQAGTTQQQAADTQLVAARTPNTIVVELRPTAGVNG